MLEWLVGKILVIFPMSINFWRGTVNIIVSCRRWFINLSSRAQIFWCTVSKSSENCKVDSTQFSHEREFKHINISLVAISCSEFRTHVFTIYWSFLIFQIAGPIKCKSLRGSLFNDWDYHRSQVPLLHPCPAKIQARTFRIRSTRWGLGYIKEEGAAKHAPRLSLHLTIGGTKNGYYTDSLTKHKCLKPHRSGKQIAKDHASIP